MTTAGLGSFISRLVWPLALISLAACSTRLTSTHAEKPSGDVQRIYLEDDNPVFSQKQREAFSGAAVQSFSGCGITLRWYDRPYPAFSHFSLPDRSEVIAFEKAMMSEFRPQAILRLTWENKTLVGGALDSAKMHADLIEIASQKTLWASTISFTEKSPVGVPYLAAYEPETDLGQMIVRELGEDGVFPACRG